MSTAIASTLGPSDYWYLTRGSGAVALVLLTASVVFGVLGPLRVSAPRWPRFAIDSLHRDISLLAIAFTVLHVVTSVLDGFAPINLLDGLLPFLSPYRPLWLGLGTLSFDLMLALAITSVTRRRLGYGAWRAIHWLAYVSWPIAVLHGLGTGTDVKAWWMLALTVVCVAAVVVAVLARVARAGAVPDGLKAGSTMLAVATPVGLAVFALAGPLHPGWARRAGTPASLLGHHTKVAAAGAVTRVARSSLPVEKPFNASLSGTLSQQPENEGAIVQLLLGMHGGLAGQLRIRMGGTPIGNGGLSLTGSQVDLSAAGMPDVLQGRITSLEGDRLAARLSDARGVSIDVRVNLNIDQSANTVTGTLTGGPGGGR